MESVERGWNEVQRLAKWTAEVDDDKVRRIAKAVRIAARFISGKYVVDTYNEIKAALTDGDDDDEAQA